MVGTRMFIRCSCLRSTRFVGVTRHLPAANPFRGHRKFACEPTLIQVDCFQRHPSFGSFGSPATPPGEKTTHTLIRRRVSSPKRLRAWNETFAAAMARPPCVSSAVS